MTLSHLNLVGDGDELDAIRAVEHEFKVTLDKTDVPGWVTVGDVYASLRRALPHHDVNQPSTWRRFCYAIALEGDDDPALLAETTRLLMP